MAIISKAQMKPVKGFFVKKLAFEAFTCRILSVSSLSGIDDRNYLKREKVILTE